MESSRIIGSGIAGVLDVDPAEQVARLKALVYGQAQFMELVSSGAPLRRILEAIALWVEEQSNNELFAGILVMDPTGKKLLHGAAPSLPDSYNNAIHGVEIGPTVGTCGTAAATKSIVIVEDMATDPKWEKFRALALAHGLRASWSTPLINKDGKVLGTFGIYYTEPRKPTEDDIELIRLVSTTALLAIQHHLAEEERKILLLKEKNAVEKLKKEGEHFFKLLMDAPALIAVLRGPELVYEIMNPLYKQVVAGERDILGKPIRQALPELERQGIFELLNEVYESGEPYIDGELLVKLDRKGNGILEDVFFNFIFQPLKNEKDSVDGIFIHAVDVTESVIARKLAEQSEEKFRSFVINSPMPIGIYVGREMRIQTANDAILETWDRDKSVIGKTFREALPELEGQPFYQLLDDVYTTGRSYQATAERVDLFRHGRMEITYYNFSYKALRDSKGEIYGVINTGIEVTDLVQARQKLQEAQEKLTLATEVAELGTWHVDMRSGMFDVSDRMKEWYGLTSNSVNFDALLTVAPESERPRVIEAFENAIKQNGLYDLECRCINQITGEERIIHARGKGTFSPDGELVQLSGSAIDITPVRMTEQLLEKEVRNRTTQLEEANKHLQLINENLKQFAYVASHDLQEPLRKINIFSDLLMRKNQENLDATGKSHLDRISGSAKRMSSLIKDLLEFSRLDSREKLFAATDLNKVINNIKKDYELLILEKNAAIIIEDLCVLEVIPLQMNQLFYNLIGNAIKFSREATHPIVKISCRNLSREEVLENPNLIHEWKYAEVVVRDNGIGFDQLFAEQIFTIFQRLHPKEQYEGTGIGLALCKKIVDNHHGEIFALSQPGNGAEFHVILPVKRS